MMAGGCPATSAHVLVAGHGAFHDGAQQVPLVAPVGVEGLHGHVGPLGDADHGGRRVAALGELGLGGGEQPPAGLAPGGLPRLALPADPPGLRRLPRFGWRLLAPGGSPGGCRCRLGLP